MTEPTEPTEPNTVTRDAQVTAAKELGFAPTQAWVLANPPKKPRSPGAERIKKSRDLAREKGIAQLNVSMPESMHGLVRELAKRTREGDSIEAAVVAIVPSIVMAVPPSPAQPLAIPELTDLPVWSALPAWKRWLVGRLIRNKS